MSRRAAIVLALLVALAGAATAPGAATTAAVAQETPAPKTSLHDIEQQVMCVVCRTPLSVAGGPQADAQRTLIRGLIAEGKTPDQIKTALVAEYGERVLALPEEKGFNLAVYLVPIVVVIAAFALAAIFLPRWRRRADAFAAAHPTALGPELSAADAKRLDDDLERYDG